MTMCDYVCVCVYAHIKVERIHLSVSHVMFILYIQFFLCTILHGVVFLFDHEVVLWKVKMENRDFIS